MWFHGGFTTGFGFIETRAVFCFIFDALDGSGNRMLSPNVDRKLAAFLLPRFLAIFASTERDPE